MPTATVTPIRPRPVAEKEEPVKVTITPEPSMADNRREPAPVAQPITQPPPDPQPEPEPAPRPAAVVASPVSAQTPPVAGELPAPVVEWLGQLVYTPKRDYAAEYAAARIAGAELPDDPGTDWARKARQKVDRLLKVAA